MSWVEVSSSGPGTDVRTNEPRVDCGHSPRSAPGLRSGRGAGVPTPRGALQAACSAPTRPSGRSELGTSPEQKAERERALNIQFTLNTELRGLPLC